MTHGNNVNDNENQKLKTNDNNNDIDRGGTVDRSKRVDMIADKITATLGARPESRPFICKVAWTQPEHRIWRNVEQALKGRNPMGLFIYLSKRDGV